MDVLGPVLCADEYTPELTLGPNFACDHVSFSVGAKASDPAAVLYQVAQGVPGDWRWTDEREFTAIPQATSVGRVIGIRFRNRVAGQAATVQAFLIGRHDPDIAPARFFNSGGGIQFGGSDQVYGAANVGDYLSIVTREGGTQLEDLQGDTVFINDEGLTQLINRLGNIDIKAFGAGPSTGVILLEATNDVTLSSNRNVQVFAAADFGIRLNSAFGFPLVIVGTFAGVDELGFFGDVAAQQAVAGSRGGNAALAALLTALANYGLIVDHTTP